MIIVNHECYVDLEVAKLLKEAGFDWECCYCYDAETKDFLDDNEGEFNFNEGDDNNFYSASTLDVAQRWLREAKNISVDISSTRYSEWEYIIRKINQVNHNDNTIFALTACRFYTYEEALEAGINKALEIILDKGE